MRIVWSGPDLANVQLVAQQHAARLASVLDGAVMLGPNPCHLAFLKDLHRWHVLIKASTRGAAQALLDRLEAAGGLTEAKGVGVAVDVDPNQTGERQFSYRCSWFDSMWACETEGKILCQSG